MVVSFSIVSIYPLLMNPNAANL